jgi:hypothetical protein
MKSLFMKAILFVAILYIISFLYISFFPMYYNSVDNTRWYYYRQVFDGEIEIKKSRILFLGDSRLNTDLDVKKIPDAWSFAAGGSSPVEMYYALKNYMKNYSNPDTVFISFSPRTLIEAYSFWGYSVRNNYFDCNEFGEIYTNLKKVYPEKVLGNFPYLHYLLYQLKYIEYYQADLSKNHIFLGKQKNEQIINHFQMEKGGWIYPGLKDSCSGHNYESHLKSFAPSNLLNIYFIMILELCKKENIHVIFDFMPMNESSYRLLNQNFVSEYKNYINGLAVRFPEFSFSDTVYSYQDQYFGDASHLNAKGKEIYTNYFLQKYFKK